MNKMKWAAILSMMLMLSACGQQSNPAASLSSNSLSSSASDALSFDTDFSNDPTYDAATESLSTEDATVSAPVVVSTPTPAPSTSTLPTINPTPAPRLGETLVQNLAKSYPGLLSWEKCRVSFQLRNPLFRTLHERMVVTFTHKGQLVEVKEVQLDMAPAIIKSYEFTSTLHADDASVATYAY
ncbi:MAG: hypothetical protein ACM3YO_03015 [Bacteroidota bacterium]